MRANGLGIKPRKRYVRTTDSNHDSPVYPNLYRNVIPAGPDMVWVADFTYIRIAAGFCYLAVILDACSRKVVGYGLSNAWIRRWHWPHCIRPLRTESLRLAAFTTRTADANTQVRPIDERWQQQAYRDP